MKTNYKQVEAYLKKLKKFLEKHNHDPELARDIEERIHEKIAGRVDLIDTEIKTILREIGSPEEIFAEETESVSFKKFFRKNQVLFLGVFKELADKSGVYAIYYRVMYIFLLFISGITGSGGLFFMLLTAYFFGFLFLRTGVIRFIFSIGLGLLALVLLVPAVVVLGAYVTDFQIEGMSVFAAFPFVFPMGLVLGIFSLIVLAFVFFSYGFAKRFSLKLFLTGLVSAIIAMSLGGGAGAQVASRYMNEQTEYLDVTIPAEKSEVIKLDASMYTGELSVVHLGVYNPRVNVSEDDDIHIKLSKTVYGDAEIQKSVTLYLQKFDLIIENAELTFVTQKDSSKRYPITAFDFDIGEIRMPVGQKFLLWSFFPESVMIDGVYENSQEQIKKCSVYYFDENRELCCEFEQDKLSYRRLGASI